MVFDKESIYDEEFSPLVAKLIELAKKHQMPMLLSVEFARTEDGNDYCTTFIQSDDVKASEAYNKALREITSQRNYIAYTVITSKDGE